MFGKGKNRGRFRWFNRTEAVSAQEFYCGEGFCPLSKVPTGIECSVIELPHGRGISQRLMDMGLCVGRPLEVLRTSITRGPVIILVGQTRLAIGHEMAVKVIVKVFRNSRN